MIGSAVLALVGLVPALTVVAALRNALRDFSLRKLETLAKSNGGMTPLQPIVDDADNYAMSLGVLRGAIVAALVVACVIVFATVDADAAVLIQPGRLVLGGLLGALLVTVFGILLPTAIADYAGEKLIHTFVWLIKLAHALTLPARPLIILDEAVKRLAGVHTVTDKEELEDDLLTVALEGQREGNLNESEREMIESVIRMSSITTEEVMTPRTDVEGLELTNDLKAIKAFIEEAGHSRIPVYDGDLDHIQGILYAKDLLRFLGHDPGGFDLKSMLRKALFVPESLPVTELLVELKAKKVHLAIVLDEYGGTTGLVTLEDVLEEIVGDIQDEYEGEEDLPPIITVSEEHRAAEMEARASIRDVNDALESLGIELPEHDDYETVGGYALAALGHIPEAGESFRQNGHAVTILEAEPTRIHKLRIEAISPEDESDSDQEGDETAPTSVTDDDAESRLED